jgi:FHA domain-containing protein
MSSRRNNPLKYAVDGNLALSQLLSPTLRGFMPAEEALRDAYDDLNSHQFGVMAGMRAALAGLLGRFTPTQLEQQLGRHVVLDLLPMHRKARLWDSFQEHHGQIRRDAEANFHTMFSREFLNAYEDRIQQLESGPGRATER